MITGAEIQEAWRGFVQDRLSGWQPQLDKLGVLWQRAMNPAEASYRLGKSLAEQGLYEEAAYRFKFSAWKKPNRASTWYNLACCYMATGEVKEAADALKRSLAINPKDEATLFMLATVEEGKYAQGHQPHTTPIDLVKSEYTLRAEEFDTEELGARDYVGHRKIYEQWKEIRGEAERGERLLDAGCGTGLAGPLLSLTTERLIGVDVTPAMLKEAKKKQDETETPYYHELIEADLRTHLLTQDVPIYDVIIAANTAPIMGGLAAFFDGAVKALKPGGWLIFSTDQSAAEEGYQINSTTRRFAHSANYLQQMAQRSGLQPRSLKEIPLYGTEPAWMVALQKPL